MPIYLVIQPPIPIQLPPLAVILDAPSLITHDTQPNNQENTSLTQSHEFQEIKSLLQTFGNEIVNLKNQQS